MSRAAWLLGFAIVTAPATLANAQEAGAEPVPAATQSSAPPPVEGEPPVPASSPPSGSPVEVVPSPAGVEVAPPASSVAAGRYRTPVSGPMSWIYRVISLLGVFGFVGVAWGLSENRARVSWRPVLWGVALQLVFGAIVLGAGGAGLIYEAVNEAVAVLLSFSDKGAAFVFASFIPHQVDTIGPNGFAPVTYGLSRDDMANWSPGNRNVAFAVLPTIIFFSALMSLAYHIGLMSPIIKGIAWVMVRTLGTSGAESLSAAANIFVGQTEAPLLVKPFVAQMTRSELNAVMVGGFATVAGGVMGVYVMLLQDSLPSIAGHLVVASILSAPAALAIAKVIVPETETSTTAGSVRIDIPKAANNAIEAAANGATDGMKLLLNVVAMLIAVVALVAMANYAISFIPVVLCPDSIHLGWSATCAAPGGGTFPATSISLSWILGWVFLPAAALMGCPVEDWTVVGQLLGEKIVLTELLAYKSLASHLASPQPVLTERSAVIASYALCGFANFASVGIQLGGIGGLAPGRMGDLATLGFRAMLGGAIAACMTGAVAGVFL